MKTIRIAAAIMTDDANRMAVVRKRGTTVFMQPGGKIDPGETPLQALVRELDEELGLTVDPAGARHLGCFRAPAAFEADTVVEAEIFHVAAATPPSPHAEIEEIAWIDECTRLALAQLTRECVLPLLASLKPPV